MNKLELKTLANVLWDKILTQVPVEAMESINVIQEEIDANNIQGDIVECGVWRGGCFIYLAHLFPNRILWAIDSFQGFQKQEDSNFFYSNEVHIPSIHKQLDGSVYIRHAETFVIPIGLFKENLKQFHLEKKDNIKILPGFINKTLKPEECPIKNIALLRIDVDAYSATMETLIYLYDKVATNGFIIFDDWGVLSAQLAIEKFFHERNIKLNLNFPVKNKIQYAIFKKI